MNDSLGPMISHAHAQEPATSNGGGFLSRLVGGGSSNMPSTVADIKRLLTAAKAAEWLAEGYGETDGE